MDGPLFPDYQSRDVLLDLKPYIDRDGYDLTQLADQGVADFTTADGGQYGLPRDLNTIVLYYNKTMFDAAGIAYPDDTWDWAKLVEVGEAAHEGRERRRDRRPVGLLHRDDRHGELLELARLAERRRHHERRQARQTLLGTPEAAGGIQFLQDLIWKEKIMADPALFAETGDAFEQGKAAMEANGSWLVPTHTAARRPGSSSASPRSRRGRPGASRRSTRPAPSSTRARSRPTRRGSS